MSNMTSGTKRNIAVCKEPVNIKIQCAANSFKLFRTHTLEVYNFLDD